MIKIIFNISCMIYIVVNMIYMIYLFFYISVFWKLIQFITLENNWKQNSQFWTK